jgi:hypothetical protein
MKPIDSVKKNSSQSRKKALSKGSDTSGKSSSKNVIKNTLTYLNKNRPKNLYSGF